MSEINKQEFELHFEKKKKRQNMFIKYLLRERIYVKFCVGYESGKIF